MAHVIIGARIMYKKFDDGTIEFLLETGIEEFSSNGLDRANINHIAKNAGVSVGVIYKYYQDKDSFFLACVEHSLKLLENALNSVIENEDDIENCIRLIVAELLDGADKHQNCYVMYNEITSGSCRRFAADLAEKIESHTASIYTKLIEKAKADGKISYDGNPRMLAFFFDSWLMMLQFSLSCDYYKERLKIFCGEDILEDKQSLGDMLTELMKKALGIK